nr:unnamed protein product [Callosobruchus analis]
METLQNIKRIWLGCLAALSLNIKNAFNLQIDKYLKKSTISEKSLISEETKRAEVKIVAVLLEHNIPFRVMHHLSDVISDSFHDSAIAKGFSCKRPQWPSTYLENLLRKPCLKM